MVRHYDITGAEGEARWKSVSNRGNRRSLCDRAQNCTGCVQYAMRTHQAVHCADYIVVRVRLANDCVCLDMMRVEVGEGLQDRGLIVHLSIR